MVGVSWPQRLRSNDVNVAFKCVAVGLSEAASESVLLIACVGRSVGRLSQLAHFACKYRACLCLSVCLCVCVCVVLLAVINHRPGTVLTKPSILLISLRLRYVHVDTWSRN